MIFVSINSTPALHSCSKGVKDLYNTHEVQAFLNSIPSKVLKAEREIYKPGTARMVSCNLCIEVDFMRIYKLRLGYIV